MNVAAVAAVRKLTRAEYDRLVGMGWFQNERVELIDGILVAVSPQGSSHAEAVSRLGEWLITRLAGRARVRIQLPIGIGDAAEPEPDVAVVALGDYSRGHPEAAHLLIEVAESSLATDRLIKAQLYARGAIPEYWIVDIEGRVVEVYRRPENGTYTAITTVREGDRVTPQAFPDLALAVSEILPGA
jgi:Uma2 family endonuclease